MQSRCKRVFFEDFVFLVDENVYEPAEDSFLFAQNLHVNKGERVLDMGTGCGILGIVASKRAGEVVVVDVNPCAVQCAKQNAALNDAHSKMNFLIGNLFDSFSHDPKFDLILCNAPYLQTEGDEDDSLLSLAWKGGKTGRQFIDRFITEAPSYLKINGRVLLMQSNLADVNATLKMFEKYGLGSKVIADCQVPFFETIVLIEAKRA